MDLKTSVENYFLSNKKVVSLNDLIKKFKGSYSEVNELLNVLYELELAGKIMGNDDLEYIHVPDDFYLYFGVVQLSQKNNFYIDLKNGRKVIISGRQISELHEGDAVFVETRKSDKHKLQLFGKVKRIVKKPNTNGQGFLYKARIKKGSSNNYYYVEIDNRKYYILNNELNGAFLGDLVTINAYYDEFTSIAKVKEVIERKNNRHVFLNKNILGEYKWVPINGAYYDFEFDIGNLECNPGDCVLFEIDEKNRATAIKKVDNDNSLYNHIKTLAYEYGLNVEFEKTTIDEVNSKDYEIKDMDIENRVDLRNLVTITIDPVRAKDMDDAISLEVLEDRYRLYVSIADVSHYVKIGSAVFAEATKRGTSCYPSNYVFPMLPEVLSNDVCSLKENEDKLAKTVIIDIDKSGNILDSNVVNSIVRTNKKMNYDRVNSLLDGTNVDFEYIPYYRLLSEMNELSGILQKRRLERGVICFESDEMEFDVDDDGNVLSVKLRAKGQGQLMIENFMLLANEILAELAYNLDIPYIYRNHESPDINKLYNLKSQLGEFKKYLSTLSNAQNPKIMQRIFLTMIEGKSSYETIYLSKLLLRNMSRANYSNVNMGHYGLALDCYGTFTSPIRRLPDLLNHIVIDYLLAGKYDELMQFIDLYAKLAQVSTEKQWEAEEFEKGINNILYQRYTEDFIDKVLSARIIFFVDNLVYLETKEGLFGYIQVKKSNIRKNVLKLKENTYRIGSNIDVMIKHVLPRSNEIEFEYDIELDKTNNKMLEKRNTND